MDALEDLVKAVVTEVESLPRQSIALEIPEPGEAVIHHHEVIDARYYVRVAAAMAPRSEMLRAAVVHLIESPEVHPNLFLDEGGSEVTNRADRAESVVRFFLSDYLTEAAPTGSLWNDAVFSRMVEILVQSLNEGKTTLDCYAPLYGLVGALAVPADIGDIDLLTPGSDLLLRISDPVVAGGRRLGPFDVTPRYFLHCRLGIPFNLRPWPPPTLQFDLPVVAFRLAAGGYARLREVISVPQLGSAQPGPTYSVYFPSPGTGRIGLNTEVNGNLMTTAADLTSRLKEIWPGFDVALSRYGGTANRDHPQDALIDAAIALESLLASDSNVEAVFRLSTRGGWVLGHDVSTRRAMSARIKALYDARSKVVHGDQAQLKKLIPKIAELAEEAVEMVRLTLLKVVERPYDRQSWDEYMSLIVFG